METCINIINSIMNKYKYQTRAKLAEDGSSIILDNSKDSQFWDVPLLPTEWTCETLRELGGTYHRLSAPNKDVRYYHYQMVCDEIGQLISEIED